MTEVINMPQITEKTAHQRAVERYNKKIIKMSCLTLEDKNEIIKFAKQAKLTPSVFIRKIVYGSLKLND